MTQQKTPMLTRIPEHARESLKALAADPEYGNLHSMQERLLDRFITEKPYRNRAFPWKQPAKTGTPHWRAYNVVVSQAMQDKVKAESVKIDVSLTTLLYTALIWWIDLHYKPAQQPAF